jgi:hypothetical protein
MSREAKKFVRLAADPPSVDACRPFFESSLAINSTILVGRTQVPRIGALRLLSVAKMYVVAVERAAGSLNYRGD